MEFETILSNLKKKIYHPVYFLMGEEPYFIDAVADYIEKNVLEDAEKGFNQSVLYGGETTLLQVLSEAKAYPLMSEHRVVIVKEAQNMRDLLKKEKAEPSKEEKEPKKHPLEIYLENPQKSTLLVFCHKYKTIDMRTSFSKSLTKHAEVLKSDPVKDYKLTEWIEDCLRKRKSSIEPKAAFLLAEYLGNDLGKIVNEIDKLYLNIPADATITTDHIQKYIGISKEYNGFELQDALAKKDVLKANKIVNYFAANEKEHPLVMTIGLLAGYFTKILVYHSLPDKSPNNIAAALKVPPFFVKEYVQAAKSYSLNKTVAVISYLREYDLKSKGYDNGGTSEGELLKELVFKILH
jgi:DNA polymerase III subunit delta